MTALEEPHVEKRRVAGTRREWSELSISIDPPRVAPPSSDARTVSLLRRARERGVTSFDVTHARHPERAERLIAEAFPSPDPELSVIVGRSPEPLAEERAGAQEEPKSEGLRTALIDSIAESRRRLAPVPVSVIEWRSSDRPTATTRVSSLSSAPPDLNDPELLWAAELSPSPGTSSTKNPWATLYTGELSLLDLSLVPWLEAAEERITPRMIIRNPFSDGRLDGTRFALSPLARGPGVAPVDVRQLHEEFDPVLRLGFLTENRRRTLAQAALRFALAWSWVSTVVIPLPDPERLEEVLAFSSSPPLSNDELLRLGLVK